MKNNISLIIQREYNQRVRKKSFIITTLLMPILMAALMILPAMMMSYSKEEQRKIVVIDQSRTIGDKLQDSDEAKYIVTDQSYEDAEKDQKEAFGFLIVNSDVIDNPGALKLYTRANATIGVEHDIVRQISSIVERERILRTDIPALDSIMVNVKAKASLTTITIGESVQDSGKERSSSLSMIIGYVGGFMIYMFIFMYGSFILQGVIEEKNSRIVEVIVSSVKPFQLMMGKILGIALVALTQIIVWVVLFVVIAGVAKGMLLGNVDMTAMADPSAAMAAQGIDPAAITMINSLSDPSYMIMILIYYILFFIGGYLLYAAMFAAVGSAVDNIQDAQQLQLPITIPLIFAIIILMSAMQSPNSGLAFWFSMIPFTSPIVMMARVPYNIPVWEIALSLVLLYGTFIAMTWVSAKIYRTGIFMYGKKPTIKELVKWARYKN